MISVFMGDSAVYFLDCLTAGSMLELKGLRSIEPSFDCL